MARARKLIGQTLWASLGQFIQLILGLAGLIILVRILGAETYGIFALGLLFANFMEVFVGSHAADGIVQKEHLGDGQKTAIHLAILAVGLAAALCLLAIGGLAAAAFETPQLATLLPAMAALPVLTAAASVPNQLLVRALRFSALAKNAAAASVMALCVGITLALNGYGLWSLLWMEVTRRTTLLVLGHAAAGWLPIRRFSRQDLVEMARFGIRRIENSALRYLSVEALPRGFIGYFLGTEALGYFAVARRFLGQLNGLLTGPVSAVSFPAASRLRADPGTLEQLITSVIRISTWVFWPALLGAVIIAPLLFPIMLGAGWEPTTVVMQILALAALRAPVTGFSTSILTAFGALGDISRMHIMAIAIGLTACLVGLPFGLFGIAAALALRQWLQWPISALYVYRQTGFSPQRQLSVLFHAAVPALVMATLLIALQAWFNQMLSPAAQLAILIPAGVTFYLLAWYLWNVAARRSALAAVTGLLQGDREAAVRSFKAVLVA